MTDVVFILDESASMASYKDAYLHGINSFIKEQKRLNPFSKFTLLTFNSTVTVKCLDIQIQNIPEITP